MFSVHRAPWSPALPNSLPSQQQGPRPLPFQTSPSTPGPARGAPTSGRGLVSLLEDVLPGEDPEDKLRLLVGLRQAGHDEVRPRLQPQFLAHFLLLEKHRRLAQGSASLEKCGGQCLPVIIVLWVEDRKASVEVITQGLTVSFWESSWELFDQYSPSPGSSSSKFLS